MNLAAFMSQHHELLDSDFTDFFSPCLVREASDGTLAASIMSPTVIAQQQTVVKMENAGRPMVKIIGRRKKDVLSSEVPSPNSCASSNGNGMDTDESYDEPQMSTPDDPVIHSPPSLGGQLMNGYNPNSIQTKLEDGLNQNCSSPDGSLNDPNGEDARRRQKTCRVCGDHATGYNFNVITCESCKAFFRRNALRPKEFKCPYSEDCEINSVSRRFCQKCRLRKCFSVGMKKEWILNDEQLRRRKNSRLNNLANQQRQKMPHQQQQTIKSPLSISPMEAQLGAMGNRGVGTPLVSPPLNGYPLMSPTGSASSDSPPSRNLGMSGGGTRSPDAYESNLMFQNRLRNQMASGKQQTPSPVLDPSGKIVLTVDEYQNLVQRAGNKNQEEEPPSKRSVYSPTELCSPQSRSFCSPMAAMQVSSPLMPTTTRPVTSGINTYMDLGASSSGEHSISNQMSSYFENFEKTIEDALKVDSPQAIHGTTHARVMEKSLFSVNDPRINYQLTAVELRELDIIAEAFKGMNDTMEPGRQKESFLKKDKKPADIMNIMDVTMRRLVKMAKKLPAFNDLSQDGKFALLKAGMIEMLTVRGATRYNKEKGIWSSPVLRGENAEVPFDMFDQLNKDIRNEQKSRVIEFMASFHEDIRQNDLAISIIMLIVLFSPRDVITDERDKKQILMYNDYYTKILHRYLESLYGDDSVKIIGNLPATMSMLREISKNASSLYVGTVNTAETEPLPREIFKVE